ncbi:MAG TPA: hypothetical protein VLM37_06915, partial [Fibrobacteraceae bacterium]|nr:hypothetical protein [Fibrobacteraceae bacterium]
HTMEHNAMTLPIRITILLSLTLLLGGCTTTSTEWDEGRTAGGIFGIVNDSLALQISKRCYTTTTERLLSTDDEYECSHSGLYLVNYRTKQSPLWGDTLDDGFGFMGQLTDSIVYGGGVETKISFWSIGQKPVHADIGTWSGSCSPRLYADRVRPWKGGKFLILGTTIPDSGDSCQYGVLDTSTGVVTQSRFSDTDAWMAGCEDISYFDGKAVCLRAFIDTNQYGMELVIDSVVQGSLLWDSATWLITKNLAGWYGSQFWISHPLENNDGSVNERAGTLLYALDTVSMTINQIEPNVWLDDYNTFKTDDGTVTYTGSDLTVTSGSN